MHFVGIKGYRLFLEVDDDRYYQAKRELLPLHLGVNESEDVSNGGESECV